jgi:cytochrome c oxidase subunit 2
MADKLRPARAFQAWLLAGVIWVLALAGVVFGARRWFPPLASEHGEGIDLMMSYLVVTTGALFLAGHLVLGYFILRFGRGNQESYSPPSLRSQRWWSILPALVIALIAEGGVLVLGIPVWAKFYGSAPPADAVTLEVVAEQFAWNVRYPGPDGSFGRIDPALIAQDNPIGLDRRDAAAADDVLELGLIYLPVGRPARVRLRSKDVLHSFYLPSQRVKQDTVPGMVIEVWFRPTKEGEFELACAELCGFGHYTMRGVLHVVSAEAFEEWLREKNKQAS